VALNLFDAMEYVRRGCEKRSLTWGGACGEGGWANDGGELGSKWGGRGKEKTLGRKVPRRGESAQEYTRGK